MQAPSEIVTVGAGFTVAVTGVREDSQFVVVL